MGDSPDGPPAVTFRGRRRGRRLRPGRQELLRTLLPRLRIPRPAADGLLDPRRLFDHPVRDVWLEVGFGAGEHLAELAAAHPDVGLIGCEPYVNGVAALLARIDRQRLRGVRIFDDDARLLLPGLAAAGLGRVFVPFPDPWPKHRHAARRLIGPESLADLARTMADGAELRLATDHPAMIRWALYHAAAHPAFRWCARRPADWRTRPADEPPTRYEEKALAARRPCVYLRFRRRSRAGAASARKNHLV